MKLEQKDWNGKWKEIKLSEMLASLMQADGRDSYAEKLGAVESVESRCYKLEQLVAILCEKLIDHNLLKLGELSSFLNYDRHEYKVDGKNFIV